MGQGGRAGHIDTTHASGVFVLFRFPDLCITKDNATQVDST